MSVAAPRHLHPITAAFVAAGVQHGLAVSDDLNGAVREGVGLAASNIRDGRRWSVVEGYLRPAMGRENLLARAGTPVAALVLKGSRVVGVRIAGPDGAAVRARRGVVVCAGAIRTPHLLMLAGIGPADHLRDRGIDVVVDAPGVGSNLHDHPLVPTLWPLRDAAALRDSSYTNAQGIYDQSLSEDLSPTPAYPADKAAHAQMEDDVGAGAGQVSERALVRGVPSLGAARAEGAARPVPRADSLQMEGWPSRHARSTRTPATLGKKSLVNMTDRTFLQS